MLVWSHGYLLTLWITAQPITTFFVCCSYRSRFGRWKLLRLIPVSLWPTPTVVRLCCISSVFSYFLAQADAPGLSYLLSALILQSAISPKRPSSCYGRTVLETKVGAFHFILSIWKQINNFCFWKPNNDKATRLAREQLGQVGALSPTHRERHRQTGPHIIPKDVPSSGLIPILGSS